MKKKDKPITVTYEFSHIENDLETLYRVMQKLLPFHEVIKIIEKNDIGVVA
jgi:hypothetical protein